MNEFYQNVFKEYENEKFPLTLLGKNGFMTFQTKEELKEFYDKLSEMEEKGIYIKDLWFYE